MTQTTKTDLVIGGTIVLVVAVFFGFIATMVINDSNSNNQRYEQCMQQGMQWIQGSCVK